MPPPNINVFEALWNNGYLRFIEKRHEVYKASVSPHPIASKTLASCAALHDHFFIEVDAADFMTGPTNRAASFDRL